MNKIIELMLAIKEKVTVFYHKDTKQFDYFPISEFELRELNTDTLLPINDVNNFRLPSHEEINHKEIMRFFVREFVEDKEIRKQLFDILKRYEYMDAYLEKLHEVNLYDDFVASCGDIYIQIFEEWAEKNNLDFK
ncbi:hypothetical protein [Fundicoccus culcitae]|uniref:Uncharacterized protein n=1 Tax=Fundicoccus culcitae TaxID=2969821 RepID=A0ABY5P8R8_9LACT|nr:hypothetical protein [Fundicoccus culcitae]UUX34818.1 hypothetical protein NRE15_03975 [Fundicoccus culcitae]